MDKNDYAAMNLRVLRENIYSFATFADGWPHNGLYDKVEEAQEAIDELIKAIENN